MIMQLRDSQSEFANKINTYRNHSNKLQLKHKRQFISPLLYKIPPLILNTAGHSLQSNIALIQSPATSNTAVWPCKIEFTFTSFTLAWKKSRAYGQIRWLLEHNTKPVALCSFLSQNYPPLCLKSLWREKRDEMRSQIPSQKGNAIFRDR